ncbi:polyribonucleotide nucleotidyltransferase [Oribacterium parvum ACB1]|jgi:polyribonucleotide nucleotidyltransferase|uniref:Polyribonucleotide nucleotidyltransferase n=1 Tax=Oribacterium parvum ACB1 TaxID=796943 RepID=G9WNB9_9FIRM|nr:polyribonucleotide nucleotidyltransferase [Oribacterium parvum]EHL11285.1 polyribonucleotide nucleotidyltransferase [Oribacterium parvum ACB1]EJF13356.1 polyribonucleotide nucleotidyltransferase [Oribacterium parvum ACB8]MBF1268347.1 polyribonucleotide nucleotidyltransferase [Oribacterium parvum]
MYKSYSMELAGRMLTIDVDRVCAQSNGAVLMHYGDTTVLSTCTASEKPRDGIDFFPLSVEYEEKMYAVGKFPGGFKKREGRASDNAILTARVIDRPMRPLFPKDYRNDVLLNNTVLSVDQDASPELLAMLGSALATSISDVPFDGPCATTQVGMIAGEFILNPGNGEKAVSDLLLTVASTKEKVIMIEAGANELPEEKMIEAIYLAHETNQQIIGFFESIIAECGKEKHSYESSAIPEAVFEKMKSVVSPEEMEKAVFTDEKQERDANISALSERLVEAFQDDEEALAILPDAIYQYEKKTVRKMILKDHKRPDGRAINEIRPLESEVDVLPRVHGSAMFKRGQTQILNITTLAPLSEVQKVEGMNEFETEKRYLHQYNFPGYSVGEAKASRGPGRREIGHGALAEKALIPVLPPVEEFPYAIRSVSETMESNGSTSMASTCASCMSLMAAGVPIRKPVAGISCGLVTGDSDDEYLVLTDIQGLEDFFGDMDFKVTGTRDGITAIQMDIKIHGLTRPIVEEAIKRAREARLFIMDGVMKDAIAEPRKELSPYAPKIITLQIETDKIGDVIGKQGKTITAIIDETGAKIDIDDSGMVSISGIDLAALERAKEIILSIVNDIEPGQILEGTVVRMMNFGAFVQLSPTKDGMVHISKLSDKRVNEVEDVVHIGDKVRVKVIEVDKMGRINLSMRPQDLAE